MFGFLGYYFSVYKDSNLQICILENKSNICYINTPMQLLYFCESFRESILQHSNHSNNKVKSLANLFAKMLGTSELNAMPFYRQIFEGSKRVQFDKKQGAFTFTFFEIFQIINEQFPAENFFFQFNKMQESNFEKIGFISYEVGKEFRGLLSKKIKKNIDPNLAPPRIIFFHFGNISYIKTNTYIIPNLITLSGSIKYRLQAQIILTKGKDKITRKEINHVYAQCRTRKGWYKIDDSKYEKINQNDYKTKIYRNNLTKIIVFTR